jgi:hypothetical protein
VPGPQIGGACWCRLFGQDITDGATVGAAESAQAGANDAMVDLGSALNITLRPAKVSAGGSRRSGHAGGRPESMGRDLWARVQGDGS